MNKINISTVFLSTIILCLSFGFIVNTELNAPTEEIKWVSIEEAAKLAEKDGKKILIDVYTDWCGWCKKMDQSTYSNAKNISYINQHFHAVKFDAEQKDPVIINNKTYSFVPQGRRGYHELAAKLLKGRMSYPTTTFLNADFSPLYNVPGYIDAKKMNTILSFTHEEAYKTTDFQAYESRKSSNSK